jgi:hypothetical protein
MPTCNHNIGECRPMIAGNTFTNHQRAILRQGAFDPILLSNQASENEVNGIVLQLNARIDGQNHWYADDLPYVVQGAVTAGHPLEPASLTIDPGTVVKFDSGAFLKFAYTTALTVTGTAEQPVIFTSLKDDSVGGDTNNDESASSPSPGDWTLIWINDPDVTAKFEHAKFHYGGGSSATPGILGVDMDSTATVLNSEVSHSARNGILVWRGAHAHLEDNLIQDNAISGIEVSTVGDVLIDSNRLLDNGEDGIYIYKGHPQVRNNFFQGNAIAVKVNCSPLTGSDCVPVISPHNRFVDSNQEAIRNLAPNDLCVEALDNWWGDESGPQDSSSQEDACNLVDNTGTGALVSDGVDYSVWEGGMARPVIARPICGTTSRSQPTFYGRALAGSTVSFYDGDLLLGQTTAASDHTFSWIPTEALTDGPHTITAQAGLDGETSLPSLELPLTVDSTLFFDPIGVRISYDFHGDIFTMGMLDAQGCASPYGDINTPLWVRPGSVMTVTVPFREVAESVDGFVNPDPSISLKQEEQYNSVLATGADVELTFTNHQTKTINYIRYAGVYPGVGDNQDTPYSKSISLDRPLEPGKSTTVTLPIGGFESVNYLLETTPGVAVYRVDDVTSYLHSIDITPSDVGEISLENGTGRDITKVYLVSDEFSFIVSQSPGGSFVSTAAPLRNGGHLNLVLPTGKYNKFWVVMEDGGGTLHIREVQLGPSGKPTHVPFLETKAGGELKIENSTGVTLPNIHLHRHKSDEDPVATNPYGGLEILDFLYDLHRRKEYKLEVNEILKIKLEQSNPAYRYTLVGTDGNLYSALKNIWVEGITATYSLIKNCVPPAKLKFIPVEGDELEEPFEPGDCGTPLIPNTINPQQPELESATGLGEWVDYCASLMVEAGKLLIVLCEDGESESEIQAGDILIDPDGYVYDAAQGTDAVIQGATVTCDMYDEDYQTWERWPAELYESQVNPQVTGMDGYYAFFVPPGLYRVNATAFGYDPHTSQDIRVINEVVHYNIPMQGDGSGELFLPMLSR